MVEKPAMIAPDLAMYKGSVKTAFETFIKTETIRLNNYSCNSHNKMNPVDPITIDRNPCQSYQQLRCRLSMWP